MELMDQITEDDIRAIYRLGEDETVAFIWNILQNYKTLSKRIQKLEEENRRLRGMQ